MTSIESVRRRRRRAVRVGLLVLVIAVSGLGACAGPRLGDEAAEAAEAQAASVEEEKPHLASRGFYERRARATGWFLARPDPVLVRSRTLSNALRAAPGVRVVGREGRALAVSGRQPGRCPLAVYVDGTYTTIRNVDELTIADIEALEVYRGPAEVPAGFNPPAYDATCGALLVWSRLDLDGE